MKLKKKKKTFDNVILSMENRHWKNSNFDGFPVGVTTNWQIDEDKLLYDEYEKVKKILKPPLREIHEYADIRKQYESMFSSNLGGLFRGKFWGGGGG